MPSVIKGLLLAGIDTCSFEHGMRIDPKSPRNAKRDRLVRTCSRLASTYGMHRCNVQVPGVKVFTSSLGHGLPLTTGKALHAHPNRNERRVFTFMHSGKHGEGTVCNRLAGDR